MWKNLYRFIKDAGTWGVASNTASAVSYVVGLFAASKYGHLVTAYMLLAISIPLFWVGSFLAWKSKDKEVRDSKYQIPGTPPMFILEIVRQPSWRTPHPEEGIFELHNCGGRAARFIRPAAQKSIHKVHTLNFGEISSLMPGETKPLVYAVDQHGKDQRALYEFLSNNPKDSALVWWDIPIEFRDTNESIEKEIVRLCFDVERQHLYSTGVPYTAQNPPLRN